MFGYTEPIYIQNGAYDVTSEEYKGCFEKLDLGVILNKQNLFSSTDTGFIWVLNSCIFVADYNFALVQRGN